MADLHMLWPHVLFILLNVFVFAPLGAYWTWRYSKKRNEYMYVSRRPNLVIISNVTAVAFICPFCPLYVISLEIYWAIQGNYGFHTMLENGFLFTSQFILFVTLTLRIWHSFHDFQVTHFLSTVQWMSILNVEHQGKQQPFLLKYKSFLGVAYIYIYIWLLISLRAMATLQPNPRRRFSTFS